MSAYRGACSDEHAMHDLVQTIGRLEQTRVQAMVDPDIPTLANLMADELVYTHSSGGRDGKTSLLDKMRSGFLDYVEIEPPDPQVTLAGSTAVVTGRMVGRVRVGGELRHVNSRTMSVWIVRDGGFRLLAFQSASAS